MRLRLHFGIFLGRHEVDARQTLQEIRSGMGLHCSRSCPSTQTYTYTGSFGELTSKIQISWSLLRMIKQSWILISVPPLHKRKAHYIKKSPNESGNALGVGILWLLFKLIRDEGFFRSFSAYSNLEGTGRDQLCRLNLLPSYPEKQLGKATLYLIAHKSNWGSRRMFRKLYFIPPPLPHTNLDSTLL